MAGCGAGGSTGRPGTASLPGAGDSPGPERCLPGTGDPYYPRLGNCGYDARHYHLDLAIDPVSGSLTGTATIRAEATRRLTRFSFDLLGLRVRSVTVDGRPARASRPARKLLITPARPLPPGRPFTVTVAYGGTPQPVPDVSTSSIGLRPGWQHAGREIYVASEPTGARTWYPVNDTPRDKATYTFRLTVPAGYTAVANGLPEGSARRAGSTEFTWASAQPIASYLAFAAAGRFTGQRTTGPHGLPILSYSPPALAARTRQVFAAVPRMIGYFESVAGRYPFASAGQIVTDRPFGWAMETQTRPLYGSPILSAGTAAAQEEISHELAHQWFGDSVTLRNWRDIWLAEGFATYLSWLWLAHTGDRGYLAGLIRGSYHFLRQAAGYAALLGQPGLPRARVLAIARRLYRPHGRPVPTAQLLAALGLTSVSQLTSRKALTLLKVKPGSASAAAYQQAARSPAPASPLPADLFGTPVYVRGALTLQALRLRIGDRAFFAVLRRYAAACRYRNATTADFTAIAERVSGQRLRGFFRTWLTDPAVPPLPARLP